MTDETGFIQGEKKTVPPLHDIDIAEKQQKAIAAIEQEQINQQERIKAGIAPPAPTAAEGIPKELPFLFFYYGSKALKCEAFQTTDEENKILAHHLSVIFGAWIKNVWVWSVIAILIIIVGKIIICWVAIKNLFKRGEKKEMPKTPQEKELEEYR